MKVRIATLAALLALIAASTAYAQPSRPMNGRFVSNERRPAITEGTRNVDMGFEPYSGSYLPRHEGPMAKENDKEVLRKIQNGFNGCDLVHQIIKDNAARSTAEKFETASENETGRDSDFTDRYKREGHDPNAETWEGFCHNWAPAGLDPFINFMVSMDKIYADVPFGIGDLRELVTYSYPGSTGTWGSFVWFGKRHNDKNNPQPESDTFDPVDLITIFENYVGPGKPGIVMDVDPGYMVWNQPFFKWSRESVDVTGTDEAGPKTPPPGGKAFKVKLTGHYGLEGHYGYRGDAITRAQTWNMYVYTDANGRIVDSAWNGSNKIPDFAWMHTRLGSSEEWERLKKIANEGVSVGDIEEFCKTMASLPEGPVSAENAAKLRGLLDKICPVLDQNKLSDYIRATAELIGEDYTNLEFAIRSETPAHS